ncbi:hypothetical protein [Methylobacterium sp. R2-1]|uniref:hypothetical protein n=1 Tax=Methylobacterium sp. R2-1 TaxID=2587064 RepID=UPI00161401BC|nr:hypothetical protein [Methylobacterium sp. R2-1]MBB2962882.1 hypothetical protein [Methylobacterium sp. R2-1]
MWIEAISVIGAFASIGAFIDFFIGKSGQKRARDWLEDQWLRLSDLRLENFGRNEAGFAGRVLIATFGIFLSRRRLLISFAAMGAGLFLSIIGPGLTFGFAHYDFFDILLTLGSILMATASLNISISLTILFCRLAERRLPESKTASFAYTSILFLIQYVIALGGYALARASLSIISVLSTWRISEIPFDPLKETFHSISREFSILFKNWSWWPYYDLELFFDFRYDGFTLVNICAGDLSALTNIFRLLILAIFLLSYLLQPAQKFIFTIWARLVESEKPVFTLIFGAIGAVIKSIQEIHKIIHV